MPHLPIVLPNNIIELHPELKTKGMIVDLAIDVCYINNESFLQKVDCKIKLKGLSVFGTRQKGQNYNCFQKLGQYTANL